MGRAGWKWRRKWAESESFRKAMAPPERPEPPANAPPKDKETVPDDVFADVPPAEAGHVFDPSKEQFDGTVLGIATVSYPSDGGTLRFALLPGDDVRITTVTASRNDPSSARATSPSSTSTKAK